MRFPIGAIKKLAALLYYKADVGQSIPMVRLDTEQGQTGNAIEVNSPTGSGGNLAKIDKNGNLIVVGSISNSGRFNSDINGNVTGINSITAGAVISQSVQSNGTSTVLTLSGGGNTIPTAIILRPDAELAATSGTQVAVSITCTYNQTSTAAATDLLINRTQTAVGSGAQLLIDAQVGGTSKFSVSNVGKTKTQTLNIAAIPTSASGLSAGDVWSNSGVLTIV